MEEEIESCHINGDGSLNLHVFYNSLHICIVMVNLCYTGKEKQMKVAKYLSKVMEKMENEFKKRGFLNKDEYTIDCGIEGRVPILIVNVKSEHRYSLANEYIAYIEEDISIKESIRNKVDMIFADITRDMLENNEFEISAQMEEPDSNHMEIEQQQNAQNVPQNIYEVNIKHVITLLPISITEEQDFNRYLYVPMGDAHAVAAIKAEGSENEYRKVDRNMLDTWQVDEETVIQDAIENISKEDYSIEKMDNIIPYSSESYEVDNLSKIYVVRSAQHQYGARVAFNHTAMEELADKMGTRQFYLLPSSIHEWIAISTKGNPNEAKKLEDTVGIVNKSNEIREDILLSHSIFAYDFDEKRVYIKEESFDQENSLNNDESAGESSVFGATNSQENESKLTYEVFVNYISNTQDDFNRKIKDYFYFRQPGANYEISINTVGNQVLKDINTDICINLDEIYDAYNHQLSLGHADSAFLTIARLAFDEYHNRSVEAGVAIAVTQDSAIQQNIVEQNQSVIVQESNDYEKQQEYENYDTDLVDEFAEKLKDFFEWKSGEEMELTTNQYRNDFSLGKDGISIDVNVVNHTYQTNNRSFYQTAMDAYDDFQRLLVEKAMNSQQFDTEKRENATAEEYNDDYFPY